MVNIFIDDIFFLINIVLVMQKYSAFSGVQLNEENEFNHKVFIDLCLFDTD